MNEFVVVSPLLLEGRPKVLWVYQTPEQLRNLCKDEFRRTELEEFLENSKPGHFIALDESNLLFRVSQH
jgi:hypothetical protein